MVVWAPVSISWDAWRAGRSGTADIERRKRSRLAALLRFVRARSPYYAERYAFLPQDSLDLLHLPPMSKREMMEHFDRLVTDPEVTRESVEEFISDSARIGELYLDRYMVWLTSGTTGEPGFVVQDQRALAVYMTVGFLRGMLTAAPRLEVAREVVTILRRGGRGAALITTNAHHGGIVTLERRRRRFSWRAARERAFDVRAPLPQIVEGLNAFQPAILGGYPSALVSLADEQAEGNLHVRPALISTSAETLEPEDRQHIEETFGCPVRDCYSAAETGPLAFDCREGRLHLNSDWFVVEPVDERYQAVEPGQPSHTVLVTNLANYVQPVIRYELGDRVTVEPAPCLCGSPLPAIRVQGRTSAALSLRSSNNGAVRINPLALAEAVKSNPGIQRFQVVQSAPSQLKLRLEVQPGVDSNTVWERAEQGLRDFLVEHGASAAEVLRDSSPLTRDPRSGKFQMVWSELR